MAETKSHKDRQAEDDIKFNRDELVSDDPEVAEFAREKRNSPMPEPLREEPERAYGWPIPEDRKSAVYPADKESDHDYKQEVGEQPREALVDYERTHGVGSAAAQFAANASAKAAREGKGMDEFQAPPSVPAREASEGKGAPSTPLPARSPRPDASRTQPHRSSGTDKK